MKSEYYNICYVCGFVNPEKLFDYSICECCLYQYGIEDTIYGPESLMEYRNGWIKEGFPFKGILGYFKSLDNLLLQLDNLKELEISNYHSAFVAHQVNKNWTKVVNEDLIRIIWNEYYLNNFEIESEEN
ncbi:MAG TPA: hypothetical protein PK622_07835 [Saprospiraceae bacterium]|nr:hypothetical protein [Saprospiraceae bacterium]